MSMWHRSAFRFAAEDESLNNRLSPFVEKLRGTTGKRSGVEQPVSARDCVFQLKVLL